MSEPPPTSAIFRFTCPSCQKVLKANVRWAGKRGACPHCKQPITFPAYTPPNPQSRTARQLLALVHEQDNLTVDDNDTDKLSMLLSQSTCRDYHLAQKLLDNRPLSPRQWRRILNSAAARESMRFHIEEQLERLAEIPDDDSDPSALLAAADADSPRVNPDAWKIITRFLYFLRHGPCDKCQRDPTGLSCIYLAFDTFLAARQVSTDRAHNWQKICHHHLGL
ncbi:MAG: hypothetical protein ACTHN5_18825 [Phycisphaerae bacterium]